MIVVGPVRATAVGCVWMAPEQTHQYDAGVCVCCEHVRVRESVCVFKFVWRNVCLYVCVCVLGVCVCVCV